MSELFVDANASRRKLITKALREAKPAQLLRVRELIRSHPSVIGYFILDEHIEKALRLFDKEQYDNPKVCYFITRRMDEFIRLVK